ncbi:MAG: hypothetical protein H6924_06095 [Alphaproteobacteria bacterium]|nr:hypothetical protein [Alphaproteobacteria bacterium]
MSQKKVFFQRSDEVVSDALRITLATTLQPCMSMPGAPPRILDPRDASRENAPQNGRQCVGLGEVGRAPSISTLPHRPGKTAHAFAAVEDKGRPAGAGSCSPEPSQAGRQQSNLTR